MNCKKVEHFRIDLAGSRNIPELIGELVHFTGLIFTVNNNNIFSQKFPNQESKYQIQIRGLNNKLTFPKALEKLYNLEYIYINNPQLVTIPENLQKFPKIKKILMSGHDLDIFKSELSIESLNSWIKIRCAPNCKIPNIFNNTSLYSTIHIFNLNDHLPVLFEASHCNEILYYNPHIHKIPSKLKEEHHFKQINIYTDDIGKDNDIYQILF